MTTPCYNCEDRCIGCHTTCGDYAIYRRELEAAKKAASADSEFIRFKCDVKKAIIHKHLKKVGAMK